MNKKILFWFFLFIGILWILGASYWYIWIENLNMGNIKWRENFTSNDANTKSFFKAVIVVIFPLLVTALLFYCIGLFFGKKTEIDVDEIEKENEHLKNELAQHLDKIETMKVLYTGGKINRNLQNTNNDTISICIDEKNIENLTKNEISPDVPQIQKDDLKIIEGIGERIEFFLNESGIYTWEQLSQQTEQTLKNILELFGGVSYKIHNPSSWPMQAELAAKGNWEDLNSLKENIRKNYL